MIEVKVKTIYKGLIGIRDKYVDKAIKNKELLKINHEREAMVIPYQEIQKKIVGKSEFSFKDKFSNQYHYLIYFKWKPRIGQKSLF